LGPGQEGVKDIAGHHRRLLAELVEKAEAEARAHEETLHLLDSPANAERLAEAIAEADSGTARELTPEQLRTGRGRQD
jgi:PHD/YefM family antitoxin component YafN of YafNO toxin-antitoxin module